MHASPDEDSIHINRETPVTFLTFTVWWNRFSVSPPWRLYVSRAVPVCAWRMTPCGQWGESKNNSVANGRGGGGGEEIHSSQSTINLSDELSCATWLSRQSSGVSEVLMHYHDCCKGGSRTWSVTSCSDKCFDIKSEMSRNKISLLKKKKFNLYYVSSKSKQLQEQKTWVFVELSVRFGIKIRLHSSGCWQ